MFSLSCDASFPLSSLVSFLGRGGGMLIVIRDADGLDFDILTLFTQICQPISFAQKHNNI